MFAALGAPWITGTLALDTASCNLCRILSFYRHAPLACLPFILSTAVASCTIYLSASNGGHISVVMLLSNQAASEYGIFIISYVDIDPSGFNVLPSLNLCDCPWNLTPYLFFDVSHFLHLASTIFPTCNFIPSHLVINWPSLEAEAGYSHSQNHL